jgi:hypothetical protein
MKSNKNNDSNNGGGDEQPQLERSARKRKLNQSANNGQPGGEETKQEPADCSSKNSRRDGRNDPDFEVCMHNRQS